MSLSRTPCAFGRADLIQLLGLGRFNLTTETHTQLEIARLIAQTWPAVTCSREHRLGPGDRPDFLVDERIVVEVKGPRHRAGPTLRQLLRYAAYPQVEAIILVTARAMDMPPRLEAEGRSLPLTVINLGRAWL